MKPVGLVFKPKTSFDVLKRELIPSFDSVLEDWLGNVKRTTFADPNYMLEITYVTPPFKAFVERIVERLDIPGVIGGPLERSFGFGKTHALIYLWHLFTSNIYKRSGISINVDVVRETLVLGMDCSKDRPLVRIIEELKAYTDMTHPIVRMKDPLLLRAVVEVLREYRRKLYSLSSEELAELISKIMEKYSELGGSPRLLLLIDELGWGFAQKIRSFTDKIREGKRSEADAIYNEANTIVNFLSYLYAKLYGKSVAGVVLWVLAEQDRKEIEALAIKNQDNETIYNKIKGLLNDLDVIAERYSRGLGGTGLAELSYSPEHALEIARYRILKTVEGISLAKLQDEYISWLEVIAKQLNLVEAFIHYKEEMKKYYPFSLGLINLLKKLMSARDVPATEFVRTVIMVASEASRKALHADPEGPCTIGVKHLNIPGTVQAKLMREFEADWADAAGDVELALSKIEPDKREAAETAAKYILAKGVTANIMTALESRERRDIERYGSTLDEIQLEIIESFSESKAFQIIEKLNEAVEKLRAESARIDEREIEERRYYLPLLFKTVYNKLTSYIYEERKNLENKAFIPIYIKQRGTIPSLFVNLQVVIGGRSGDVIATPMEYRKIKDIDALSSDPIFQEAQNKGKLLLILIPPWNMDLFNEMYMSGQSYEIIVSTIAKKLQNAVERGKIKRHLHVIVLLPNLAIYKLSRVLDKLAEYEGTKKFLNYLSKKEIVINERLREFEDTLVKRKDLLSILSDEIRRRHLRELRSRLEREIVEAKSFAQKRLVRLSREIVIDVLELYHKVIYYSIDKNAFTSKDIIIGEAAKIIETHKQYLAISNLAEYASIINRFLADIIRGLAYEYDAMKILNVLLDSYKKEFEQGTFRECDKMDEVLENLMLGTYDIKPLSIDIAIEAVKNLNNQRIELEDKTIIIAVDEKLKLIKFIVEAQKPTEEITVRGVEEGTATVTGVGITTTIPPPERVLQNILLELPPGFNVNDVRTRLVTLMNLLNKLKAEVSSIELKLDAAKVSLNMVLKRPSVEILSESSVKAVINLLSRVSSKESRMVFMDIRLSKPIAEDNVKKVFGEYFKTKRSSFDKFLPT